MQCPLSALRFHPSVIFQIRPVHFTVQLCPKLDLCQLKGELGMREDF